MSYYIKQNYIERKQQKFFDARESSDEYQDYFYKKAFEFAKNKNLKKILDIGCGSGFKLIKYFNDFETVGCEVNPTYEFLLNKYPKKKWFLSDFSYDFKYEFDFSLSIDVIEHLIDPIILIDFLKKTTNRFVLISTPNRDFQVSKDGPPVNIHHIREWNYLEFERFISEHFTILESESNICGAQYIIGEKK